MRNNMRHLTVAVAAAILCSAPAFGQSCTSLNYDVGSLMFGRIELGADRSTLPSDITSSANCLEQPAQNYYDCEYYDLDGVRYLVYGHQVVRKTVTMDTINGAQLPFGLRFGDSVNAVLAKVVDLPEGLPRWQAISAKSKNGFYLTAGACLADQDKTEWHFHLKFNSNGALTEVSAFFTPE